MAKITFDGATVPVKQLNQAKVASLLAFHQVTGWNLKAINEKAEEHEVYGLMAMAWLSLWEAGEKPDWGRIQDATLDELTPQDEPGDAPRTAEDDAADPQTSRADSDPGGAPETEDPATEARTVSARSSRPSRGSTSKSPADS